MSTEKFIFTQDRLVANQLRNAGYIQIPTAIDFLFLNEKTDGGLLTFENIDTDKVVFTSNICL